MTGFPRLFRKRTHADLNPSGRGDVVAQFFAEHNLLIVDGEWWDAQPEHVQSVLWKDPEALVYASDFHDANAPPLRVAFR